MSISLAEFIQTIRGNLPLAVTVLLTLSVILVNGWTDAPNAIATCVSTRAIRVSTAIRMAAVFNFLGVLAMAAWQPGVAMTIYNMVDFGSNQKHAAIALCAALLSIVLWATAAWAFGIPTSESHALIAGLSGAAIALHGSIRGINLQEWSKVLLGLLLSTLLGLLLGYLAAKGIAIAFRHADRVRTNPFFQRAQITGGAAMAFMHGAQDGQKFMGVFLLGIALTGGGYGGSGAGSISDSGTQFIIPIWLMLLCSAVMALGTAIGGKKIIRSVGMEMVTLTPYRGFSADLGAAAALLISSLSGIPVSTTHTKTTAIMGATAAHRTGSVNWRVVREMVLAWIFTFPGCGVLGYLAARLLMMLF